MGVGLTIFISLLILVVLGLGGIIAYFLTKDEEEKEDRPHFDCFIKQNCGHSYGKVLKIEKAINGNEIVTYKPQDISLVKLKKLKKIEPIKVIIPQGNLHLLPKGSCSNDKDRYLGFGKNADDFPKGFKETLFGKWMTLLTELQNTDNTIIEAYKERVKRQTQHIKEVGMGEATRERIQHFEGLLLDSLKNITEIQKTKTATSFSPTISALGMPK